ncbi:MAG: DUF3662 and FHA domain-containing protein [Chloroflexia bacterium]|nr:DUF3662 and FHA domain-containing protein [Chloroflexia bacterium]
MAVLTRFQTVAGYPRQPATTCAYNRGQLADAASLELDRVKLLEKFEQSIERLMEGTSGSLFRQSIQPAEIGKKLERAMLAQQRVSVGTAIVPNLYVVNLHPKDYAQFADYREGLARQMESWLAQVATERNLSVVDRIRVTLNEDPDGKRRNPMVTASITDSRPQPAPASPRRSPPPTQATSVYRVEPPENRRSASLHSIDGANRGRTFIVPPGTTSVGRSPENDIVLDFPDVSRRHARIDCGRDGVRVQDLNSTNGTRLNGDAIRVADVDDQDELAFGGQRLVIEFHDGGRR